MENNWFFSYIWKCHLNWTPSIFILNKKCIATYSLSILDEYFYFYYDKIDSIYAHQITLPHKICKLYFLKRNFVDNILQKEHVFLQSKLYKNKANWNLMFFRINSTIYIFLENDNTIISYYKCMSIYWDFIRLIV